MLEHYLSHSPVPLEEKPEAVEVVVERDLDAQGLPPLKGVIDLVRQGGVIVDFKTTARAPDPVLAAHQNEVQLGCYALLYREAAGRPESGFELHHLVKTREPKLVVTTMSPIGTVQMRRLVRAMESYVQGVEAEDYVPSPGQHCAWCDFFGRCRAWRGH
jgi:putative RecB family exonuclease